MNKKDFKLSIGSLEKGHFYNFIIETSSRFGDKPVFFGRKPNLNKATDEWYSVSYNQILEQAEAVARKLHILGLQKGDKVLIIGKSKPEFSFGFCAIPLAGGVIVPLDPRLSLNDQKYICEFSQAKFVVCTNDESLGVATKIIEALGPHQVLKLFMIDNHEDFQIKKEAQFTPQKAIDLKHSCITREEMMLMTFTSGTTNLPKGVMLSWNNLDFQIQALQAVYSEKTDFRMLSILPIYHLFELVAGFLLPYASGGEVFYGNSLLPHQVMLFIKQKKIRDLLVVPLFLRTLKKGLLNEILSTLPRKIWFKLTFALASLIPSLSIRRVLFFPLHRFFGGELRQMISGASALDQGVGRFFDILGISIYEGYGMTEASPVICCSSRFHKKPGSIGKPLSGLELKLHSETNEILVRGPSIMLGYFNDPQSTFETVDPEGWLRTGDIGDIDKDGFVSIKGRNKDTIVLGNGKKIFPDELEEVFRKIPGVQEVCVLGIPSNYGATKGTEVVLTIIVPRPEHSQEEIEELLRIASQQLSYFKRPTKFVFFKEPLPTTSTLKIKKNVLREILIKQRINV